MFSETRNFAVFSRFFTISRIRPFQEWNDVFKKTCSGRRFSSETRKTSFFSKKQGGVAKWSEIVFFSLFSEFPDFPPLVKKSTCRDVAPPLKFYQDRANISTCPQPRWQKFMGPDTKSPCSGDLFLCTFRLSTIVVKNVMVPVNLRDQIYEKLHDLAWLIKFYVRWHKFCINGRIY